VNAHVRHIRDDSDSIRPMPANIEIEQAFLGGLLMDNNAASDGTALLKPEHFHEPAHAMIFEVAAAMLARRELASPATLMTYLPKVIGDDLPMGPYLARLCAHSPPSILVSGLAKQIIDLASRRQIIEAGRRTIQEAFDPPPDVLASDIAGRAIADLTTATEGVSRVTRRELGKSAGSIIARARRVISGAETLRTVTTGIPELDAAMGGFSPGDLIILAGRPGMGKSSFIPPSARGAASAGAGVIVFQLELPEAQMTARFLAEASYSYRNPIRFGQIMRAELADRQIDRLDEAQQTLDALPIMLDVAGGLTMNDITARVRSEKARMAKRGIKLGVVFIDQLDFVKSTGNWRGDKVNQVGEISIGCKQLAKDEDVAVVLFSQLNRGVEGRDDRRPGLADLRNSGNLEQDADVVGFFYREAYYIERSSAFRQGDPDAIRQRDQKRNVLELILAKNRTGDVKTLELYCDIGSSVIGPGLPGDLR